MVGITIAIHDPTNFSTYCLEDFTIVVVLIQAQAHKDLGGDGTPTSLPSLVVFFHF